MSVFLKDVHYYPFIYENLMGISTKDSKYPEVLKEVNELATKIEEKQYLLLLNLSANDDNKEINKCINDCAKWIKNMPTRWEIQTKKGANKNGFKYKDTPTTNLLVVSRDYFKREWSKAKKGK